MNILGIIVGHDSSACLLEDGVITRYIQEERFNRIKCGVNNAIESVNFCIKDKHIDEVVVSETRHKESIIHLTALLSKHNIPLPNYISKNTLSYDNVRMIGHHEAHAASSYYTSGFDDALVIAIDGIGNDTTHFVAVGEGSRIKPVFRVYNNYVEAFDNKISNVRKIKSGTAKSLGFYYGSCTEALGWRASTDEGKTMGLAPYGDPNVIPKALMTESMYDVRNTMAYSNNGQVHYHYSGADEYLKVIEKYGRENFAASAQALFEEKALNFIRRWMKRTGKTKLCTAGGIFLNVKLNQRICEMIGTDNYWPFPLSNDSGCSIGSALYHHYMNNNGNYVPNRLKHLYLGDEFSDEQIRNTLVMSKINYRGYDKNRVAQSLSNNKIWGWFTGRMEAGPRSLGGRSILMSPLRAENKDIINAQVKHREGFRPFCPTVLRERTNEYFDGGGEFMITSCKVKSDKIPAVTHVDNTARPQILDWESNPKYYELIEEFSKFTRVPVLLNTSLNVMGEPIIRTPEQALRCFYSTGLDGMVLGNYIIEKVV